MNWRMNMRNIFILLTILISQNILADGLPLKDGRYVHSDVIVFDLTENQKKTIQHYDKCQLENFRTMNAYTPYIFKLTEKQSEILKSKKGFSPSKFQVYETYKGFNDAGPHWNMVLRFSENEIEIPIDLLITDTEAKEAHDMQGWDINNPCFPK